MRPAFHRDLATARVAGLHHHAARERVAQAAVRNHTTAYLSHPVGLSPFWSWYSRWPTATA
jgi:hypothetical protein